MEEAISNFQEYATYGLIVYAFLFLYSLGGGMVGIIVAGVLSFSGLMNIYASISVALVANFIGDTLLLYMSRYNKEMVWPYIKKHRRKLALSHLLMKRYGDKIIILKKYIYGLKTLVPIAIGLTSYSFVKFSIYNFIGATIWAVSLGYGSYLASDFMKSTFGYIYDNPWIMPIVMVVLLGSIWYYFTTATKRKG